MAIALIVPVPPALLREIPGVVVAVPEGRSIRHVAQARTRRNWPKYVCLLGGLIVVGTAVLEKVFPSEWADLQALVVEPIAQWNGRN